MKKSFLYLLTFFILISCSSTHVFNQKWLKIEAPEVFKARFETTQGNFDIEAHREWSPLAVDRLYQLITTNYYTDIAIFRVVPGFVAQFGIHDNPILSKTWEKYPVKDEPVLAKNNFMTVAYARDGKDTRAIQLFINLADNNKLDTVNFNDVKGFPVIAKVISGSDIILNFYDGYGNEPAMLQDSMYARGNAFIEENYPRVDYIKRAYIIP